MSVKGKTKCVCKEMTNKGKWWLNSFQSRKLRPKSHKTTVNPVIYAKAQTNKLVMLSEPASLSVPTPNCEFSTTSGVMQRRFQKPRQPIEASNGSNRQSSYGVPSRDAYSFPFRSAKSTTGRSLIEADVQWKASRSVWGNIFTFPCWLLSHSVCLSKRERKLCLMIAFPHVWTTISL